MLEVFFCYVAKIPDVVWSAVIASFLTFLGVFWSNRGHAQRQKSVLEYESEKFKCEQNIALKKEVFLEAAASFSRVLTIFPRLADLNITDKEISGIVSDHGPVVSKTYLVAKEETVSKLLEFSNDVSETYLSLVKPRAELLDFKAAIEIYEGMISKAENEKDRLVTIMREFNLQGRTDQKTFNFLQSSYEVQDKLVADTSKDIDQQRTEMAFLHKKFIKDCVSEYARLSVSIAPMIIAVRQELDNNIDSKVFVGAINESMSRMKSAFDRLLSE